MTEKDRLIDEICLLSDQATAIAKAIEDRKNRLRLRMSEDGDRVCATSVGAASFYNQTTYTVHDSNKLGEMFSKEALLEICKPNKTFVDAAIRLGVDIGQAISSGVDPRFKVEHIRSAEAQERQRRFIAESRQEIERRVCAVTKLMQTGEKCDA